MKNILHKLKPRLHHHHQTEPINLVHHLHNHLLHLCNAENPKHKDLKHQNKFSKELLRLLDELHLVLYGDSEAQPDPKACSEIAIEFFKDKHSNTNPFRLLLKCFADMEWESKTLASQIVTNLMRQHLPCCSLFIASEFLEENMDLVDFLLSSFFDLVDNTNHVALLYGIMLRECLCRSQIATQHVLNSPYSMHKFLEYVTLPDYSFAAHVGDTLELLLTRHKSPVADFLSRNYEWFFEEFNSKLLASNNQLTKLHALSLLAQLLLEGKNCSVMERYVSNVENLKLLMNALMESKCVQLKAFHVFKLFVDNPKKPTGVIDILRLNKTKLLRFMEGLKTSYEDESFDEDKTRVIRKISMLEEVCYKPISLAGQLRKFTINVA